MTAGNKGGGKARRREGDAGRSATNARRVAFDVLRRVEGEAAYASALLPSATEKLRADDRGLAYELVLGVLRRRLWLDCVIARFAKREAGKLDLEVLLALRLGVYQLRFLSRIPPSAAVNESVNLVRAAGLRSAAGFVNAVLRSVAREAEFDPAANIKSNIERIAIEHSHPAWLVERWAKLFGEAETEAFAAANNRTPPTAFRVNPLRVAREEEVLETIRAAGGAVIASGIASEAWRAEGASGVLRRLSEEGKIYLQDEASQLVAHTIGAQAGERVLDLCAAPGSKTTHTGVLTKDGAHVVAGDIHFRRLAVVREAAERQGLRNIRLTQLDAERELPFQKEIFDRVLVDAPCTGTGTLRRNPEIRWRIAERDARKLAEVQARILLHASACVRAGGRLVYSTCSVEPEENEEVIGRFLALRKEYRVLDFVVPSNLRTELGAARTWPHKHDVDGFFMVALVRESVQSGLLGGVGGR